jgi:hypothetical protein
LYGGEILRNDEYRKEEVERWVAGCADKCSLPILSEDNRLWIGSEYVKTIPILKWFHFSFG